MNKNEIQEQALKAVLMHSRAGVEMTMGTGKTMLGLTYIRRKGGKALVVVPRTALKGNWQQEIKDRDFGDLDITFTTYRSLLKHDPKEYSCIIFDEAHNLKETAYPFIEAIEGSVLGLTGTPPRHKGNERYHIMQQVYPIRYVYDLNKALEDKLLNNIQVNLWGIELSNERNLKTKSGKWTSEKQMYSFLTSRINSLEEEIQQELLKGNRMAEYALKGDLRALRITRLSKIKQFSGKDQLIKKVIHSISQDEKVLVFTSNQEQCSRLFRNYHTSLNNKARNEEVLSKFKSGEYRIIAAIDQLSEGINIPNLRNIIISHSYASEQKPMQKIGRALRLNPKETASVHILYYKDTIDEEWVKQGIQSIDPSKIIYK